MWREKWLGSRAPQHCGEKKQEQVCLIEQYYRRLAEQGVPKDKWPQAVLISCPCQKCSPAKLMEVRS